MQTQHVPIKSTQGPETAENGNPTSKAEMGTSVDAERPSLLLKAFGRLLDASEYLNRRQSRLGNPATYDVGLFPWAQRLEDNWQSVGQEVRALLPRREQLPNFQDIAADVGKIQNDDNWKTFFLYAYGCKSERNCAQCPVTAELVASIPGMMTAFFSILSPGKHIPPHRGPYNGVLRYHLGLIIPEPKERCRIRIGSQIHHWREGESLIFDDTFDHEVWNDTDGVRVILFVDFLRPVGIPADQLRGLMLRMVRWTPFIKAGQDRHSQWEERFHNHV